MLVASSDNFSVVYHRLKVKMAGAPPVKTERWQGVAANTDTLEIQNVVFEVDLRGIEDLDHWRQDAGPNLPWADDTFLERVGGEPLNPGESWKIWPWSQSARGFKQERFNHAYPERLWPRYARRTTDGRLPLSKPGDLRKYPDGDPRPKFGVGHHYGDLQTLVELLATEPHTRQAVIPLFYPEETGTGDGGRKMCSLLYQFMVRDGRIGMYYPLRSCDLRRHFRDDCYLAVRMLLWVLDRCREIRPEFWKGVVPGSYVMHCSSLHVFATDKRFVLGEET